MIKLRDLLRPDPERSVSAARGVALVSAAFSLILGTLLVVNYLSVKSVDPLNSRAMNRLMREYRANPGDRQLQDEIRALNLLSRKAFFAHRWQLHTGVALLLVSTAVFLVALRVGWRAPAPLPDLEGAPPADTLWMEIRRNRRRVAVAGGFLLGLSLLAGFLYRGQMEADQPFSGSGGYPSLREYRDQWACFRGPGGNGVANASDAPTSWSGEKNQGIRWKVEVPRQGYSSPVIWGNRLFLTGADEKTRELFCYTTDSGKLLWRRKVGGDGPIPTVHHGTGFAASSAATNGRQVFAIFATGDLAAFDMDGHPLWSRNLGAPENHYGHASSLITHEDMLLVQYDQSTGACLMGLDAATGDPVWRTGRTVISWSSPVLVDTGKRVELILTNSAAVSGYDPRSGAQLWEVSCLGGEMGPSAAYANGMVFVANQYAVAAGIRLGGAKPQVAWQYTDRLPDTASPLAVGDLVFLTTSKGDVVCLDAATGKERWVKELNDGFYSSPVLVGKHIYAMDLRGVMHIFPADGSGWRPVAESSLGEPSACTPAVLDGKIYIRGERFLYCIGS